MEEFTNFHDDFRKNFFWSIEFRTILTMNNKLIWTHYFVDFHAHTQVKFDQSDNFFV